MVGDGVKKINGKNVGFIKVIYTEKIPLLTSSLPALRSALLFSTCVTNLAFHGESIENIVNSLKVE
jgi:hypothetical protein